MSGGWNHLSTYSQKMKELIKHTLAPPFPLHTARQQIQFLCPLDLGKEVFCRHVKLIPLLPESNTGTGASLNTCGIDLTWPGRSCLPPRQCRTGVVSGWSALVLGEKNHIAHQYWVAYLDWCLWHCLEDPLPEYGISGIMFWEGAWNHSKESICAGGSWRGTIFHTAQWNLVECSSKSCIIMGQCIHVSQGLVFEKLV